jgi:TonB family protein
MDLSAMLSGKAKLIPLASKATGPSLSHGRSVRRRIAGLAFACFCAYQPALHAQDFKILSRDVQIHGFASQGFVYTNNWLTMNTTQSSGAFTEFGFNLITRVEPEYPETLKRLNIGGTVRLRVSISAKGNVDGVEVLGGNPILGESAAIAVKHRIYAAGRTRSAAEVSIPFDNP